MIRFERVRRLFRLATRRVDVEREIGDELKFHFDACVAELTARGLSHDEALREARRRFGDVERYRDALERLDRARHRRHWLSRWSDVARQDLRYSLRGMRRSLGFTVGVAATLALGVGANATMFGVIDRILLRPPPHVVEPSAVKRVYIQRAFLGQTFVGASMTYPDVQDWVTSETFDGVGTYAARTQTLGSGPDATRVSATFASASLFPLLGVRPALGRSMLPDDDVIGAEGVALLGHHFWQRHFGGDPDVLGRVMSVGPSTFTIVGVLPSGFNGVELRPVDVWLPLHQIPSIARDQTSRGSYFLRAIVRLRDRGDVEAAQTQATQIHRLARREQTTYDPEARVILAPLQAAKGPRATDESRVAQWLAAVAAIVLVIACANVANLLLARGAGRRREIAVRLALGVSRRRLIVQSLNESIGLAVLGGLGALLIARWGSELVGSFVLPGAQWSGVLADPRVLGFTFVVSVFTGVVAGLVPAIQMSRADLHEALRESGRAVAAGRSKTRTALLVAQASLAVVLLVGSGLFVQSLRAVRGVDLGFDMDRVVYVRLEPPPGTERDVVERAYQRALERVSTVPGVVGAALTSAAPFRNSISVRLRVPGRDSIPILPSGGPYVYAVTPEFFETIDIDIVRGRGIETRDVSGAMPVAVVNRTMARYIWGNADPLGQCLLVGEADCTTVVGIAEDSRRQQVIEEEEMLYYVAHAQRVIPYRTQAMVVRTGAPVETMESTLRREVFSAAPELRFVTVTPYQELIDPQFASWRLGATMFTVFGALALVVAAIGLYAVLAFDIAQRSHEFGIRSALGAAPQRLVRLVVRHSVALMLTGIAAGALAAALIAPRVEHLLYGTSPREPAVYLLVTGALLVVAILASAIPAARAIRVDPAAALRSD